MTSWYTSGPVAGLSYGTRSFYLHLAAYLDENGRIFVGDGEPSEVIARVMRAGRNERRAIPRQVTELIGVGVLKREGRDIVMVVRPSVRHAGGV